MCSIMTLDEDVKSYTLKDVDVEVPVVSTNHAENGDVNTFNGHANGNVSVISKNDVTVTPVDVTPEVNIERDDDKMQYAVGDNPPVLITLFCGLQVRPSDVNVTLCILMYLDLYVTRYLCYVCIPLRLRRFLKKQK